MRLVIALLGFFLVIGGSVTPVPTLAADHGALLTAADQGQGAPTGKLDVDIDVNRGGGGGVWYANPIWIGVGILALILVIAIIAMASRGGGTTVIKD